MGLFDGLTEEIEAAEEFNFEGPKPGVYPESKTEGCHIQYGSTNNEDAVLIVL